MGRQDAAPPTPWLQLPRHCNALRCGRTQGTCRCLHPDQELHPAVQAGVEPLKLRLPCSDRAH